MNYINCFYQNNLCVIGGVETFLYDLAKLASVNKRDLTVFYSIGDHKQIARLKKYCRVLQIDEVEKPIKCKKAFFNYNVDPINYFEAEEYIQIVHADFQSQILKDWNYVPMPSNKITKYYAVSKNNAKSFKELTGKDIEVLYNPINIEDEPRVMTIISAQRTSPEKGGKRLEYLIRQLDLHKIPYVWHHFSQQRFHIDSPNVMYHEPDLDIRKWIKYADYMVLLSDTEGFPYSAYESLCLGTPLIVTRLPVLDDLGANDTNAIILDFDMSNLDVDEIYEKAGTFKFEYKQKPNKWLELIKGKSTYTYIEPTTISIQATLDYTDK